MQLPLLALCTHLARTDPVRVPAESVIALQLHWERSGENDVGFGMGLRETRDPVAFGGGACYHYRNHRYDCSAGALVVLLFSV